MNVDACPICGGESLSEARYPEHQATLIVCRARCQGVVIIAAAVLVELARARGGEGPLSSLLDDFSHAVRLGGIRDANTTAELIDDLQDFRAEQT